MPSDYLKTTLTGPVLAVDLGSYQRARCGGHARRAAGRAPGWLHPSGRGYVGGRRLLRVPAAGLAVRVCEALDGGAGAPPLARIAAEIAPTPPSAVHVFDAADLGDTTAGVILDRARRALAAAVVSIVNVFGPDLVILGGGITIAWGERLIAPTQAAVEGSAFRIQGRRARVVPAALGDDVGLIGTVPLVASALPGLVTKDDHQQAAADSAIATT